MKGFRLDVCFIQVRQGSANGQGRKKSSEQIRTTFLEMRLRQKYWPRVNLGMKCLQGP